jgi:hypothetical protein
MLAGLGLLAASQLVPSLRTLVGATPIRGIDYLICAAAAMSGFLANRLARPRVDAAGQISRSVESERRNLPYVQELAH